MNLIDPQTVLSEASHDMIEESLPKILQACKNLPKNSQNGLRYKKTTNTLNDARSILLERMPILCNQYRDKLVQIGFCEPIDTLLKQDMLDMCRAIPRRGREPHMMPPINLTDEEYDFVLTTGWLTNIPCFEKGILRINHNRYIKWELLSVDASEKTIEVLLRDFYQMNNIWEIGIGGMFVLNFKGDTPEEEAKSRTARCVKGMTQTKIYNIISPSDMHWDKLDREIWKIVQNNARCCEEWAENHNANPMLSLATYFSQAIIKANYILTKNKPSKALSRNNTKRTIVTQNGDEKQETVRVRTVGNITVKSNKPPKAPTYETIVHYRTAQWTTRGHIRHYKNGKTVYVKESVHKRKCLNKTDNKQTRQQTVINIVDAQQTEK